MISLLSDKLVVGCHLKLEKMQTMDEEADVVGCRTYQIRTFICKHRAVLAKTSLAKFMRSQIRLHGGVPLEYARELEQGRNYL